MPGESVKVLESHNDIGKSTIQETRIVHIDTYIVNYISVDVSCLKWILIHKLKNGYPIK